MFFFNQQDFSTIVKKYLISVLHHPHVWEYVLPELELDQDGIEVRGDGSGTYITKLDFLHSRLLYTIKGSLG